MADNLDKLIEEYSQKLMQSIPKEQIEKSSISTPSPTEIPEETKTEEEDGATEKESLHEGTPGTSPDGFSADNETQPINTDPENFSTFLARVFTGGGAYAVPDAKIVLYKGDILQSFLTTDENGETKSIRIEAYPEENSLEPLSDEQRLNYSADVFADGFTEKKNLLVSAVGGADIILNVELTPESEGIN